MRVLWLNANLLLPLDKGGKLRTWHLMRHLARRHDLTYVCFADPREREAHGPGMTEVCAHLDTVPRVQPAKGSARFYARVLRHLADPAPFAVAAYRSRAYRAAVDRHLDTGTFECLVCDFLVPAVNLRQRLPCPSVLFTHNVEAEIWRRHADTAAAWTRRAMYDLQWRRMQRFEAETLARFDRVLAVSDADRETFQSLYPGRLRAPVTVVPTGVDTAYFRPPPGRPRRDAHLVFLGSMDWLPNEDAVVGFCRDVLPRIRAAVPEVTFSIVGRDPTPAVRRLTDPGRVLVTGRVDDVRPALHEATVSVVPLRIGGGTRLKIFEAMAAGVPVVSTTIGAEGLPATPGQHLLIGDTPETFAAAVVALIQSPVRRDTMAETARRLVCEHFDWASAAGHFERALIGAGAVAPVPPVPGRQAAGTPIGAS